MDRHLFALRKMAEESGIAPPSIFTDPSYARMNHNILSTSTLVSPHLDGGGTSSCMCVCLATERIGHAGFGPVVSDGFGIGYGTTDDGIAFVITTYLGKAQLDKFVAALDTALQQVRNTLSDAK